MNSKISYPDFSWGSVNKYGVFITLVHWVHSMVEPCGRVPSRCSLWTSLVSGILQANLHIKSLVMRVGNVVCFLKFLKTRESWNLYYFLLNNRVINAGIITKRRGHVRPHGKIYIYNSNPKLIFITEKQNSSYDVTVTDSRHWTITTQKSYLSLADNNITAKLTIHWSRRLAPRFPPIRCKTEQSQLVRSRFPALCMFCFFSSEFWLALSYFFLFFLRGWCGNFGLVLKYTTKTQSVEQACWIRDDHR